MAEVLQSALFARWDWGCEVKADFDQAVRRERAVFHFGLWDADVTWLLQHDNEPGWPLRLREATEERWKAVIQLARCAVIEWR